MDVIQQIININKKLNLEILDFQNELFEISHDNSLTNDEKEALTNEIHTLIGTYVIHCERIKGVLQEIENDSKYIDNNVVVFNDFFTSLNNFNNKYLTESNN